MKQTTSIANMLAAILPGIALALLLASCGKNADVAQESEVAAPCPECQAYVAAVSTLEITCLSSSSVEGSAEINATLDILKKAASGSASISAETIRGARKDWDAIMGRAENDEIRKCLQSVQDKLLTCIDRCVANKQASAFPPELHLQIRLIPTMPLSSAVFPDRIVLGMTWPPRVRQSKHLVLEDGWFHDDIATPEEGREWEGLIHRAVKEGHEVSDDPKTTFCLTRAPKPVPFSLNVVQIHCSEGEACGKFDDFDPGWLVLSDKCETSLSVSLFPRFKAGGFSLIQSAEAQTPEQIWVVPSIKSLAERQKTLHDGYTAFSIKSAGLGSIDANGVSVHLRVNGVEVRVEGMPGEFLTTNFDPGRELHLEFGLENLDFEGRNAGCDIVSAELRFWKDGTQLGKSVALERLYAALRDGEVITQDVDGDKISWSAHYVPPLTPVDWRVFFGSFVLGSWDELKDPAKVRPRVDKLEATRSDINRLGLVYDGRPVVAVMRPPLSKPSYGLAFGLRQETGQIRFTFNQKEALEIRAFLLKVRGSDEDSQASKLIRDDIYAHMEHKITERPSNCLIG